MATEIGNNTVYFIYLFTKLGYKHVSLMNRTYEKVKRLSDVVTSSSSGDSFDRSNVM